MRFSTRLTSFTIFFMALFSWLNCQTPTKIIGLSIDLKRNGLFVHLHSTNPIKSDHITGWYTEQNWFYVTILSALSDTIILNKSKIKYPIIAIQVDNINESTQIAFKVDKPIESFEFYQSIDPPEIMVSMRFPIEEVIAALVEEKQEMRIPEKSKSEKTAPFRAQFYSRLKTALYLAGTSLTIAGVIEQDNANAVGWELPLGITILTGTYFFDTYIYPELTHD